MGNSLLKKPYLRPLEVVRTDGQVIKFTAPLLVKELLINFQGFGVKSSEDSSKNLPPGFRLELGRTYYLIPSCTIKRIKVVITKQQLQQLLSEKTSAEKIVLGMDSGCCWRPCLASIPEE